uniref:Protein kinase domain-containing protein n=1 Tax=Panagrolaimus sp. ES5 TaxID=591445 RepID=A0AC34FXY2_9BILA
MTSRQHLLRANRIHGPGKSKSVEISFTRERLHANGVFSNVYSALLTSPQILPVAIKKCWPRNSVARKSAASTSTITNQHQQQVKSDDEREDANDGKAEISLLSKLKHFHIVSLLYSFSVKVDSDVCNCMVLEFLPTDLGKLIKNRNQRKIDLLDSKLYSWQLFAALDYIASKGIAHRDIKPSNLLVDDESGILKLADFGNAKKLKRSEEYPPYQVTRYYRAPELVFGSKRYTTKVDVWAAGCVLGELLIGKPLFPGISSHDQGKLLVDTFGYPSSEQLKAMAVEQRPRLIRKNARGLKTILPGAIVDSTAFELLESILRYDPSQRLSYDRILGHTFFDILRSEPIPKRRNGQRLPAIDFWISEETTQSDESK